MPTRAFDDLPRPVRAEDLPPVVLTRDRSAADVVTARRRGALVPVARGIHVPASAVPEDRYGAERARLLAAAVGTHQRLRTPHVLSHTTAALLWGLPMVGDPLVHVTQWTRRPGTASPACRRHFRSKPDDHAVMIAGLPATDLEQTVIDCVAGLDPSDALVIADAALRAGTTVQRILERLDETHSHPYRRRVRDVVQHADGGAESPGETRARVAFLRLGLPTPVTQLRVVTADGTYWSDLGWPELRLLAEYDGRAKYGTDGDITAVLKEKRRQELLEEAGHRVIRLIAADLHRPEVLLRRVRRLLLPDTLPPATRRPELAPRL